MTWAKALARLDGSQEDGAPVRTAEAFAVGDGARVLPARGVAADGAAADAAGLGSSRACGHVA